MTYLTHSRALLVGQHLMGGAVCESTRQQRRGQI
jgi:hypothetical protein